MARYLAALLAAIFAWHQVYVPVHMVAHDHLYGPGLSRALPASSESSGFRHFHVEATAHSHSDEDSIEKRREYARAHLQELLAQNKYEQALETYQRELTAAYAAQTETAVADPPVGTSNHHSDSPAGHSHSGDTTSHSHETENPAGSHRPHAASDHLAGYASTAPAEAPLDVAFVVVREGRPVYVLPVTAPAVPRAGGRSPPVIASLV